MAYNDEVFGWDSIIEEDGRGGSEYILLPEGDYTFTVAKFERAQHNGSAKLPACPKAVLTLEVETDKGPAHCTCNLYVCKEMEAKLSDFFRCIGQKKRGERLKPDWAAVPGSKGRAHFRPRPYNGNDYNDCQYFIDPGQGGSEKMPWEE